MSHFAKIVDGIVTQTIVAEPEFFDTFVDDTPGEWLQTSYNTMGGVHYNNAEEPHWVTPSDDQTKAIRKNFAGVGFTYDSAKDAFIPPTPFESWVLNETSCLWEAPIPYPTDGLGYGWDEDAYQADNNNPKTAGWVQVTEDE